MYRRAVAKVGRILGGADHQPVPTHLLRETRFPPPALEHGRPVLRLGVAGGIAVALSVHLATELAREILGSEIDRVVVVESTGHAETLVEEIHLLPIVLAPRMLVDQFHRHRKDGDTRIL